MTNQTKNNFCPLTIGAFSHHVDGKNTTRKFGEYFERQILLPFAKQQERMLRVWLPPGYFEEPEKRYPVLYMSDGQNLIDDVLTAFGSWHLDQVVDRLSKKGLRSPILVGIDCPKDPDERWAELHPPYAPKTPAWGNNPYGNKFVDYMADIVKPEIDATFRTLPDLLNTGIGGSSMGGIMAFYAYLYRKETFGFSLAFSIPVFTYTQAKWKRILAELGVNPEDGRKLAIFVGGVGFEKKFVKDTRFLVKYLRSLGFDETRLHNDEDLSKEHHEESWCAYAEPALEFWLKESNQ